MTRVALPAPDPWPMPTWPPGVVPLAPVWGLDPTFAGYLMTLTVAQASVAVAIAHTLREPGVRGPL